MLATLGPILPRNDAAITTTMLATKTMAMSAASASSRIQNPPYSLPCSMARPSPGPLHQASDFTTSRTVEKSWSISDFWMMSGGASAIVSPVTRM